MRVQREGMRFIILIATTALAAGILFLGLTVAGLAGLTDSSAEASTTSESSAGVAPAKAKKERVQGLTLRYHDLGLGSSVSVQLVKDPKKGVVSSATVVGNRTFKVQTKSGEKDLGAKIELGLNGSTKIAIHVSCSKDIDIGFFFADDDDKTIDARSAAAFNPAGFKAALEIVSLEPVGVCGSAAPTPTPTPPPPTPTPPPPTPTPPSSPKADLMVIKIDAPDPVQAGSILTYIATVRNLGPDTANDVVLVDFLPDGVTFISATPSQGSCTALTCHLGNMPAGSSAIIEILVRVDQGTSGTFTNLSCVDGSTFDPNPNNNCDPEDTTVPSVLPRVLPDTGGDPEAGADGAGMTALALTLALAGLALVGGSAWAVASLRRKKVD